MHAHKRCTVRARHDGAGSRLLSLQSGEAAAARERLVAGGPLERGVRRRAGPERERQQTAARGLLQVGVLVLRAQAHQTAAGPAHTCGEAREPPTGISAAKPGELPSQAPCACRAMSSSMPCWNRAAKGPCQNPCLRVMHKAVRSSLHLTERHGWVLVSIVWSGTDGPPGGAPGESGKLQPALCVAGVPGVRPRAARPRRGAAGRPRARTLRAHARRAGRGVDREGRGGHQRRAAAGDCRRGLPARGAPARRAAAAARGGAGVAAPGRRGAGGLCGAAPLAARSTALHSSWSCAMQGMLAAGPCLHCILAQSRRLFCAAPSAALASVAAAAADPPCCADAHPKSLVACASRLQGPAPGTGCDGGKARLPPPPPSGRGPICLVTGQGVRTRACADTSAASCSRSADEQKV